MTAYAIRRLLSAIPVMAVVAVFVFLLLRLTPGDPAAVMAGDLATVQDVEAIRRKLGLDEPILVQFGLWISSLLRGDLGTSLFSGLPVSTLILQRLEPTLVLTGMTFVIAVATAVPMGVVAAWRVGSWLDRTVMGFAVLGFSVPVFVFGYMLIYVFAVELRWLPVQGYRPLADGVWESMRSLILPAVTLGVLYIALIARITRASMLEVLSEDYVRTARAKGVSAARLLMIHALKNAAIPIITVIGIGLALAISGVVVNETVFNVPGLGRLTVDAILKRDYPIIQAMIMLFSGVYVFINVLIDILYSVFDPRIRY